MILKRSFHRCWLYAALLLTGLSPSHQRAAYSASDVTVVKSAFGYQVGFPNRCDLRQNHDVHIALCHDRGGKSITSDVPATYPLLMVFRQSLANKKDKWIIEPLSPGDEAAFHVCGSQSLKESMRVESHVNSQRQGLKAREMVVLCPADDYGVIKERVGHYLVVTTKSHRYHVIARFLASDKQRHSQMARAFVKSFKIVATGG